MLYAACKAGMINGTRTIAVELAEHRIRVKGIAPDLVPTEHMAKFAPSLVSAEGHARQERHFPLSQAGNLDECAGAAVFLASSLAAYVNGVTINVDGGTCVSRRWTRGKEGGWKLLD